MDVMDDGFKGSDTNKFHEKGKENILLQKFYAQESSLTFKRFCESKFIIPCTKRVFLNKEEKFHFRSPL